MKKIKLLAILLVATVLVFVSCQREEDMIEVEEQSAVLYPEVSSKLQEMYFNTNDIELVSVTRPDGVTQEMYKVEGDILFTQRQIEEMEMGGDITSRQYRVNNLVNTFGGVRTLKIMGWTGGGGYGLSSKERSGLQWAVNNYNRLNLNIRFSLSFGTSHGNKNIVIYHDPNESGSGGEAGFPSGGNPHKWIRIYGLNNLNTNVAEHVIGHEVGHAVGFRHADWWSRQSCGQNSNEGTGPGAIHIPGTPTGYDSTSQMLACFSNSTNGEFNNNDKTALRYLY